MYPKITKTITGNGPIGKSCNSGSSWCALRYIRYFSIICAMGIIYLIAVNQSTFVNILQELFSTLFESQLLLLVILSIHLH